MTLPLLLYKGLPTCPTSCGPFVCEMVSWIWAFGTSYIRKPTYLHRFRQGWYVSADFVNRVWTGHHQPADHWRALHLPTVLQQLSKASDLVKCQDCIQHEFHPVQCSQANQNGGKCVVLLAGHKGIFQNFIDNRNGTGNVSICRAYHIYSLLQFFC